MKDDFDSPGRRFMAEDWHKYYLRNPVRFIEDYLDIKLTLFQRMIITLTLWNRGKEK